MPTYHKIDNGFTIGPNATQNWSWNWFGFGPNQGPVIFMADPKSGQSAEASLLTFDLAKVRGAPNSPHGNEVFYRFKIKNLSNITVAFNMEIIRFKDLIP